MNRSVAWGDGRSQVSQFQWQLSVKNLTTQPGEIVLQLTLSSLAISWVFFGPLARHARSLVPPDPEFGLSSDIHWTLNALSCTCNIQKEIIKSQHKRSASFVLFSICLDNLSRTGSELEQCKTMHLNFPHCWHNEEYCCCFCYVFPKRSVPFGNIEMIMVNLFFRHEVSFVILRMTKRQQQQYLSLFVFVSVKWTNANLRQHSFCSKEHNRAKRHCFHINSIIGIKRDHYILIFIIFALIKEIHVCRRFLTSRFGLSEPSSSDIIPPIFAFSLACETIRIIRSIELSSTWIFIFYLFLTSNLFSV